MPTKKMIITQNLAFNLPLCVVMTITAAIASGAGFNPGTIIQYFIGLVVIEILAAYIGVLIFLPLSMKISGMDKLAGGPPPQN